jgi:hypothetical protein
MLSDVTIWTSITDYEQVHIRAHKGDRAFRCDFPQCDSAGFFSKSNLAAHKRIHLEGRAKWVCKLEGCTKTFSSTGNRKVRQQERAMKL